MTPTIVETDHLTKRYRAVTALDDCRLTIRRGEIFGLLGPNGAGKTTLLRLLLGYLRPTLGRAVIDGLDCYRQSVAVHERVAYLPGDVRLFHKMTGHDVLAFFGRLRDRGYTERANRLARRLDLQLAPRTTAMSTGMRQKLGLVAVLAVDAPTLILDEPTANLDPTVRKEVAALVREAQTAGKTVVFSSHVLEEVERLCDRVAILRRGKLVHEQSLHTLRRQHRIRAELRGPIPNVPKELSDGVSIEMYGDGLTIVTAGELSPLLAWLATLSLSDVRIEPVGLGAIYEQFHAGSAGEPQEPAGMGT
jgi:ABC-2 type transport system ATP-binding protein